MDNRATHLDMVMAPSTASPAKLVMSVLAVGTEGPKMLCRPTCCRHIGTTSGDSGLFHPSGEPTMSCHFRQLPTFGIYIHRNHY